MYTNVTMLMFELNANKYLRSHKHIYTTIVKMKLKKKEKKKKLALYVITNI